MSGARRAERPLRVAVTGATGFIGAALVPLLREAGHTVVRVSRGSGGDVRWDPDRGELDPRALAGVDAAVDLAGENIGQRWTDERRRRIVESRERGTGLLARTLAALEPRPRVLVSVSGVNWYGDAGDAEVCETSPPGEGFLAEVTRIWEAAAEPARRAGIRVVHPRLGVVLHPDDGALARMLPVFRLGLGGRLGGGRQWLSWVSRDDAARALRFLLEHDDLAGPVNVVAEPVRNEDFTRALAGALHRPAPFVVPGLALKAVYGQMAEETLLGGQRASGDRLRAAGFEFRHATIEGALRAMLGGESER